MDVEIFLKFLLVINVLAINKAMRCIPRGSCGCVLEDGSKYIDLSPLVKATGKSPMFVKVPGRAAGYNFDIDLCHAFLCGQAKTKFCLKLFSTGVDIGNKLTFDYKYGVVTFIYSSTINQPGSQVVATRVTMHCTSKDGLGSFTPFENNAEQTIFTTTFTSKYACWKSGGGVPTCKAKGPCGCEMDDGSGFIDLSLMMHYGSPMFKGVALQSSIFSLDVDLCQKFKCINDGDAQICATSFLQSAITADSLSAFEVNGYNVTFVYTRNSDTGVLTTRIAMHCSQDAGIGQLSNFQVNGKVFTATLTSQYACLMGARQENALPSTIKA